MIQFIYETRKPITILIVYIINYFANFSDGLFVDHYSNSFYLLPFTEEKCSRFFTSKRDAILKVVFEQIIDKIC